MKTNKNDEAFPSGYNQTNGLTKLEYFAAAALQGILANHYISMYNNEMAIDAINIAKMLIDKLNEQEGVSDENK